MFVRSALEFRLGSLALAPRGRRRSVSAETRGQFLPASQRRPADNFSEWCGQFRGQFCVQFCVQFLLTIFLAKLAETLSRKSRTQKSSAFPGAIPRAILRAIARAIPRGIARAHRPGCRGAIARANRPSHPLLQRLLLAPSPAVT